MKNDSSGFILCILLAAGAIWYTSQQPNTSTASAGTDEAHARAYVAGDFAFADSSTPDKPEPPKPAPGKCPVCNGTGKVGDGRIFVDCGTCGGTGIIKATAACPCGPDCKCATTPDNPECKCPACKCDPATVVLPNWNPVKLPEWNQVDPVAAVRDRQLLWFHKSGEPLPQSIVAMKNAGWAVGDSETSGAVRIIDIDKSPNLAKAANAKHGTWARIRFGRIDKTCWLDLNAQQIASFYETGEIPTAAKQKRFVRQCGPNGCRLIEVE